MCTEHAIAFKLRLGEELITRALVRERWIGFKVFVDVARFVAVTSRLDVNDNAIRRIRAVDCE